MTNTETTAHARGERRSYDTEFMPARMVLRRVDEAGDLKRWLESSRLDDAGLRVDLRVAAIVVAQGDGTEMVWRRLSRDRGRPSGS